jgi:NTP pyrophosphatase (non-canonical NTP hydrolase)
MTTQQQIFDDVQTRGYIGDNVWLALHQQGLKITEEAMELMLELPDLSPSDAEAVRALNMRVRQLFDNPQPLLITNIHTAVSKLTAELADVAVVAFVMAELLGVDLLTIAKEKAEKDKARGRRA